MKLKRKRSSTKKIILIATLITLLVAGSTFAYLVFNNHNTVSNTSENIDYSAPTDEQKQAGQEAEDKAKSNDEAVPTQPAPSPNQPTQKKSANVSITSTIQDELGVLKIRTVLGSSDSTPGICTLTIKQGDLTLFSDTAQSEKRSEYSTCQGFNVTKAQLKSVTGQITVSISYAGTAYEGNASTQVNLQ